MHQALPAPPDLDVKFEIHLSEQQIKNLCDKEFMKLLKVIAVNDEINYCIHIEEKKVKYYKAFASNIDNLLK